MKRIFLIPFLFGCGGDTFTYPPDSNPPTDDGGIEAEPFDGCIPAKEVCFDAGTQETSTEASTPDTSVTLITTSCGKVNPSGVFCGSSDCTGNVAKFADAYCVLAGFTKAASYEILDSGMVQCLWIDAGLQAPSNCNEVHYGAGYMYLSDTCEAIQKLECQ